MNKQPRKKKKKQRSLAASPVLAALSYSTSEPKLAMELINLHAAAADIGSREHYVCVGLNRQTDVRIFGCTTEALNQLADWLESKNVTTFAMESTGHYWYALYDVLTRRGKIAVMLVNGRYSKNISGRKSDLLDCEWLYKLHTRKGKSLHHAAVQHDAAVG